MANLMPKVEWFDNPNSEKRYGLVNLALKWAVVESKEDGFRVITDWVDDRKTAIGFLKLLKEK